MNPERCTCGEVAGQHEPYPGAGVQDVPATCPVHHVIPEPPDDWTGGNDGYLLDWIPDFETFEEIEARELAELDLIA